MNVGALPTDPQEASGAYPLGSSRKLDGVFFAFLALAALTRAAYAIPYHVCFGDESCYLYLAQNLFGGKGYTYYNNLAELHFPPLFPIALGLLNFAVRDWEMVSRVAYVVFGTLLLAPVYLLALRTYGVLVARIAAMVTALLPAFTSGVLYAETMSEPLYLFCLACGIYQLYLAFADGSVRSHVLASTSFAFAYLTRPEGMIYFFLALGSLPLYWLLTRRFSLSQAACRLGALAAGFFLVAFPYLVYVRGEVGTWTLSTKGRTTYLTTRGLVPHEGKVDGAAFLQDTWGLDAKGEVHYFAHEFDQRTLYLLFGPYRYRLLQDMWANLHDAWDTLRKRSFLGEGLLALAAIGLASSLLWRRRSIYPEIFHLLMLAPLTAFLAFFIKERFLYPLLIPCILWMACGIEALLSSIEWAGRFRLLSEPWRRRALQACVCLLSAALLTRTGYQLFARRHETQPDLSALTQAIKTLTPIDAAIVCAYPHFAFHAQRRWLPLPVGSLEEVCRYAKGRGASYLAVVDWRLDIRPEEQRQLLEAPGDRPGLETLETHRGTSSLDFVIYRFRSQERQGNSPHAAAALPNRSR